MLLACSVSEDATGAAQKSLGDGVSTLLALSIAMDDFCVSPNFLSARQARRLQGHQLLRPPIVLLSFHVDNALYRLVATFYEHLASFHFPPQYALKLMAYTQFGK
jgi:hypothetical protein